MKMYVVGAAPTGDAPTTSEWSTILLATMVRLIIRGLTVGTFYAIIIILTHEQDICITIDIFIYGTVYKTSAFMKTWSAVRQDSTLATCSQIMWFQITMAGHRPTAGVFCLDRMTSWHGNVFRITGKLWGNSLVTSQKQVIGRLDFFRCCYPLCMSLREQYQEQIYIHIFYFNSIRQGDSKYATCEPMVICNAAANRTRCFYVILLDKFKSKPTSLKTMISPRFSLLQTFAED